jgi:hypothetical protein
MLKAKKTVKAIRAALWMFRMLKRGSVIKSEKHLTATSRKKGACDKPLSNKSSFLLHPCYVSKKRYGVIAQRGKHPAAQKREHRENGYHFWQKSQSLLLDGSGGLENRHNQADNQGRQQDRRD